MIKVLQERNFPISELRPLASARSAGKRDRIHTDENMVKIQEAAENAFEGTLT